jgi:hypothetical protein
MGHGIHEYPHAGKTRVEDLATDAATFDDGEKGMEGNGKDPGARGQITYRHEPAICPARCGANLDFVLCKVGGGQGKGHSLLDVCQHQVVDKDEKLVGAIFELASIPPNAETTSQKGEKTQTRDKRQYAEESDSYKTTL